MGKWTASNRAMAGTAPWITPTGTERTLDPVAERLPAPLAESQAPWCGYPAAMPFASALRQSLQAAAIDRMVCPDDTADLVLAVSEAFANAIRHGESDPEDMVWVCQEWQPEAVTLRLRYRGAPFPAEPPTLPALDATSGRGRYIMSRLMDRVEYRFQDGWTEVTLARRLQRPERAAVRG